MHREELTAPVEKQIRPTPNGAAADDEGGMENGDLSVSEMWNLVIGSAVGNLPSEHMGHVMSPAEVDDLVSRSLKGDALATADPEAPKPRGRPIGSKADQSHDPSSHLPSHPKPDAMQVDSDSDSELQDDEDAIPSLEPPPINYYEDSDSIDLTGAASSPEWEAPPERSNRPVPFAMQQELALEKERLELQERSIALRKASSSLPKHLRGIAPTASMSAVSGGVRKRTAPKRYEPLSMDKRSNGPSTSSGVRKRTAPKRYEPLSLDKKSHGPKKLPLEHFEECALCEDGGDLLLCDFCPRVFCLPCLGLSSAPSGMWHCPCHKCHTFDRSALEGGGKLFHCTDCTYVSCFDCTTDTVISAMECTSVISVMGAHVLRIHATPDRTSVISAMGAHVLWNHATSDCTSVFSVMGVPMLHNHATLDCASVISGMGASVLQNHAPW
eukprot:gene28306-31417_t